MKFQRAFKIAGHLAAASFLQTTLALLLRFYFEQRYGMQPVNELALFLVAECFFFILIAICMVVAMGLQKLPITQWQAHLLSSVIVAIALTFFSLFAFGVGSSWGVRESIKPFMFTELMVIVSSLLALLVRRLGKFG